MQTTTAQDVKPGMTIKTQPGPDGEPPVTLRVEDGFFCGPDYAEPRSNDGYTHVSLADRDGNDVLLPVATTVWVVNS